MLETRRKLLNTALLLNLVRAHGGRSRPWVLLRVRIDRETDMW